MVAVSKGYLVPAADFAGTVHSVFATACNLTVDGRLLTVHDAAAPHTPTSVRVVSWRPRARAGGPARCAGGILTFGEHALDLRALPVWTPPPPPPPAATVPPAITAAREVARIRERHVEARGIPAVPGLAARAESLLEALTGRPRDVPRAVAGLVGLGPGLTPSGDDLLVGALAVLSRAAPGSAFAGSAFPALAYGVRRHAHRTTDVGAHYLRLAAAGHFGEPLVNLVDALVTGAARAAVPALTQAALRVGASSGADGVAGVLLGLRALGSSPDRKAA
ncbi:DUF2877 domain-containing protein [Bailinhaonella thermotolerans]|uniref:DUF2877 domain-containing protein n=1 Tax=Bailinhaonella thermotolerans TaxID=1070861 RepID=A0A3A4BA89_9ACTN|nr:DUF2877 domain-containing protein [Bailinhaonella thermotolerans]RJL35493.1 DUF2877 domain-containing protein [Bailinhaonella thermotolerans]